MIHCTPFLLVDGTCAQAMTFYQHCLGGELTLTKLSDTPMKDQFPIEKHNRIINAQLKSGVIDISATDWMASPSLEPKPGNTVSLFLIGEAYQDDLSRPALYLAHRFFGYRHTGYLLHVRE